MRAKIPTAVEIARNLIRLPSIGPEHGEAACAAYVAGLLEDAGFRVRAFELQPNRPNLVALPRGGGSGPWLCFSGHLDTVALGGAPWSFDPFEARIEGDRLLGRGASDMKGGLAAMLHAVLALSAEGRADGICLVLTADEEHGLRGAKHLVTSEALPPVAALVVGEPTANAPLVGHKGGLWFSAEFSGRAAHGSMPELGENAITKAAAAMLAWQEHGFKENHPVLGRPTLNIGVIQGGTAANIVPDHCRLDCDCRLLPGMDPEAVLADLAALAPQATLGHTNFLPPVWTDPDHPWISEALAVAADTLGPVGLGGATYVTDASVLSPALGAPALILGPGEPGQAHQTDEWCSAEAIDIAAQIYQQIAIRWQRSNRP